MRKRVRGAGVMAGAAWQSALVLATGIGTGRLRLLCIVIVGLATMLANPAPASAIPAYPWSAVSERPCDLAGADADDGDAVRLCLLEVGAVDAEPPFASLLGTVPAAPAFIMPAPESGGNADGDGLHNAVPDVQRGVDNGSYPYSERHAAIICAYDWDCEKALRVAACESGPDLWAEGGYYVGTFQIDPYLHGWRGDIYTPAGNVAVAYQLWQEQGWAPWPVCGWR